MVDLNPDPG